MNEAAHVGLWHLAKFFVSSVYVQKILSGGKPADMPVEQPTKFDLTINLRTARALGIQVPPLIFARDPETIE